MTRFAWIALAAIAIASTSCWQASADWPQWGGSGRRNNVSGVRDLPTDWDPGTFDRKTGRWESALARNIKWVAELGSQTYGTPAVADGRIFVGTNNSKGYLKRYPAEVDLGCLLCFRERDGEFLWQFSAEKLPTGRAHDWPLVGLVSSPLVESDRAWFVSNRGEVVCVDTQGFYDEEDDGPTVGEQATVIQTVASTEEEKQALASIVTSLDRAELPAGARVGFEKAGESLPAQVEIRVEVKGERWSFIARMSNGLRHYTLTHMGSRLRAVRQLSTADKREADVVWRFDMMKELGSRQHNMATCCITSWKDTLFVCTSNGVDETHHFVPAPEAPSFLAMDKHSGTVLWTSNLPGANILHGQWSAPAVGRLGGVPQVIFCGGDGWVYSFHAEQWNGGRPRLLWKFDTNAKDTLLELGGRGTRNEPFAPPVLHDDKVYVTTGQDPEHGEGTGCVWCIDATKKLDGSDVSPHKVVDAKGNVVPPRRATNFPQWNEVQLGGGGYAADFDKGLVSKNFRDQFRYRSWPLASEVRVKPITPGAEWELIDGEGESQETIHVWRRKRVNELGEFEEGYVVARRSQERIIANPDSAVVWKYDQSDRNGNGKIDFDEQMHRSISSVVIHDKLLFCIDFAGLFHCLDARTGKAHWTCDLLAAVWGTPLIADGRVFVADEDGDVAIFRLSADPAEAGAKDIVDKDGSTSAVPALEVNMLTSILSNPVAANGVLYITTKDRLFAIQAR